MLQSRCRTILLRFFFCTRCVVGWFLNYDLLFLDYLLSIYLALSWFVFQTLKQIANITCFFYILDIQLLIHSNRNLLNYVLNGSLHFYYFNISNKVIGVLYHLPTSHGLNRLRNFCCDIKIYKFIFNQTLVSILTALAALSILACQQ